MNTTLVKRNSFWLVLSLAVMLVSALGASIVQGPAIGVSVKEQTWETASGRTISGLLLLPDTATAENPAPVIVVTHGWWNNKEMQGANYVELARRGFVVLAIDMYGHGNSDALPNADLAVGGTGLYDAVQLVADLPYIDRDRIGVSGHSNGARAANFSVALDNAADEQLIASVFLVDNDPVYFNEENTAYTNIYGARDVGLVADQYDEFFFRSYSPEGAELTPSRDYITTANAQSFLNFGIDPADGEERVAGEFYTERIDGTEAIRIVTTPAETHPWGTISKQTVGDQIAFWEESFGAPNAIEPTSQLWQIKEAFTALGLIGFAIFLVAFPKALLGTRAFAGLRVEQPVPARRATRGENAWLWGGLAVSVLFSGASYLWLAQTPLVLGISLNVVPSPFTQGAVFFIALWAAINGLAAIAIMTASYLLFGRKHGASLRESGVLPGWRKVGLALGLAVVTTAAAFGIVFLVDYFFTADFRLWVLAVKAFTPDKLLIALTYVPFFALYFLANSAAVNGFNRFATAGREWANTAILALANSLAPIVMVVIQYVTFAITGYPVPGIIPIFSIWLFPVIVILAVSAIISRKLYRATGNPYVGGFINAFVVTLISVTNTLTVVY